MENKNQNKFYEQLYASNLKDIEKNLDFFIKQKEEDFYNQKNKSN